MPLFNRKLTKRASFFFHAFDEPKNHTKEEKGEIGEKRGGQEIREKNTLSGSFYFFILAQFGESFGTKKKISVFFFYIKK